MKKKIEKNDAIFPMPVLMVNTIAEESVLNGEQVEIEKVSAIAFDPYTHGYYKVSGRVGEAYGDGLSIGS